VPQAFDLAVTAGHSDCNPFNKPAPGPKLENAAGLAAHEPEMAEQFAALPWQHVDGIGVQVLLVTSRISKHWLVPKGWRIDGKDGTRSACQEALEEAGVKGKARHKAIGSYDYVKITNAGDKIPCRVTVFGLKVKRELEAWPEDGQRTRQWFTPAMAANLVTEPGLRDFLARLDVSKLV
jgi:8-oxo-dGTP pyrophosphatase MutT (NUDIX family)